MSEGPPRRRAGIVVFLAAAACGLVLFGVLTWRSVSVQQIDTTGAQHNFEAALASVPSPMPLVSRDASGRFVRRASAGAVGPRPAELHVLAYHADRQRLVRADVPLWFFKVKGPAVRYALQGTGFDLEALGMTAADLEQAGSGVVLDETRPNGDRVLAWTR